MMTIFISSGVIMTIIAITVLPFVHSKIVNALFSPTIISGFFFIFDGVLLERSILMQMRPIDIIIKNVTIFAILFALDIVRLIAPISASYASYALLAIILIAGVWYGVRRRRNVKANTYSSVISFRRLNVIPILLFVLLLFLIYVFGKYSSPISSFLGISQIEFENISITAIFVAAIVLLVLTLRSQPRSRVFLRTPKILNKDDSRIFADVILAGRILVSECSSKRIANTSLEFGTTREEEGVKITNGNTRITYDDGSITVIDWKHEVNSRGEGLLTMDNEDGKMSGQFFMLHEEKNGKKILHVEGICVDEKGVKHGIKRNLELFS